MIWATVPHVTIAPIARGVGRKVARDSRYFPYYTRPWIDDAGFDPRRGRAHHRPAGARGRLRHRRSTTTPSRPRSRRARDAGRDWYLIDIAGLLDRLAPPALHRGRQRPAGLVDAVPAARRAGRARPGARLALRHRRRRRRPRERRALLARRRASDDGRLRADRAGADQHHAARRRRVPARQRRAALGPGDRRLRAPDRARLARSTGRPRTCGPGSRRWPGATRRWTGSGAPCGNGSDPVRSCGGESTRSSRRAAAARARRTPAVSIHLQRPVAARGHVGDPLLVALAGEPRRSSPVGLRPGGAELACGHAARDPVRQRVVDGAGAVSVSLAISTRRARRC